MAVHAVLNTADSGPGSLRAAVAAAADGDVVQFADPAFGEIALASELTIDKDLTIHGLGAAATTLGGGGQHRVLTIAAGADVSIDSLTITGGGNVANGGGIANAGTLALNAVDVTNNLATARGGGIYNNGSLTLINCNVANNAVTASLDLASGAGGGIDSDVDASSLTISDSTIAENSVAFDATLGTLAALAQLRGGGLAVDGHADVALSNVTVSGNVVNSDTGAVESPGQADGGGVSFLSTGAITLTNCTIAYNRAGAFADVGDVDPAGAMSTSTGGGVYFHDRGSVAVTNTIVAHNDAVASPDVLNFAANSTFRHDLIGNGVGASGVADNVDGNHVGSPDATIDPLLEPLAYDRAATMTHALAAGTPALDAGDPDAAPVFDQRGVGRTSIPDIGAYELGSRNARPTFTSAPPTDAAAPVAQPFTYIVTTDDADGDAVVISASNLPAWLTLSDHGDGTATLSGTPSDADAGANAIKLVVADGTDSSEQNFTLDVAAVVNHAPTMPAAPVAAALAGQPFALTVSASDVDGQLLGFAVVAKPDWLTVADNVDGTATMFGTPSSLDAGMNQVVLQVSDGAAVTEQTFEIDVVAPRWTIDASGTLAINGASGDDVIHVWTRGNGRVRVIHNGEMKNFAADEIRAIEIRGLDGHDEISVNSEATAAYVLGGAGNDTLLGGDEADNLVGGGGKDLLDAGGGDDRLDGGDNDDRLAAGAGDDRLLGGAGNDRLCGGDGADDLRGEAGDDVLYSRDDLTLDSLSGDAGNDFAEADFLLDHQADELTPLLPMPLFV